MDPSEREEVKRARNILNRLLRESRGDRDSLAPEPDPEPDPEPVREPVREPLPTRTPEWGHDYIYTGNKTEFYQKWQQHALTWPTVPFKVGVHGDLGHIQLGSKYAPVKDSINIQFYGMDENAAVGPIQHGSDFPVTAVGLTNITLIGNKDSFAWRQAARIGKITFDNVRFRPHPELPLDHIYTSGLHFHKGFDSFRFINYRWSGEAFREHTLYIKGGGEILVENCEMKGGNRSFIQYRPHGAGTDPYAFGATPEPSGPVVIRNNFSTRFGHNHVYPSGGAVITIWCTLENTVLIERNKIEESRYGAIMVGRGATNTNPPLTSDGFSHSHVLLKDNELSCNGDRHCVSISDTRLLEFVGQNKFYSQYRADLVINAQFSSQQGAQSVSKVLGLPLVDFTSGLTYVEGSGYVPLKEKFPLR